MKKAKSLLKGILKAVWYIAIISSELLIAILAILDVTKETSKKIHKIIMKSIRRLISRCFGSSKARQEAAQELESEIDKLDKDDH